jgi:SSS family solute:Na+ symporter
MQFAPIDWLIVAGMLVVLVTAALWCNRHTQSVGDYLVAGRAAGRYMMTMASGMVWIGAINVVAMFELFHAAGFTAMWWVMLTTPFALYLYITGFGVYRFRETRALTVAQFLETRYSKPVRITAGLMAWVAGLINFGLFPAVGARFFIAFAGLPWHFHAAGITWPTFPIAMVVLLGVSLFFVFIGGHVAVIVTDCLQGMFTQIAAVIIVVALFVTAFHWDKIVDVLHLMGKPADGKSLLNPMQAWNQAGGFTLCVRRLGENGA